MTKDEALRLALKALENSWTEPNNEQYVIEKEAITALRLVIDAQNMASKTTYKEALETKDEPVAWEQFYPDIGKPQIAFNAEVVVYVAPQRKWVGLKDDDEIPWDGVDAMSFAKAIEAKLKGKNA